jgi:hypothetical protein
MNYDIVVVRDGDAYRLLHGHLRLATLIAQSGEAIVDVQGEGTVRIARAHNEYFVGRDGQRLPLHRQ